MVQKNLHAGESQAATTGVAGKSSERWCVLQCAGKEEPRAAVKSNLGV